MRATTVRKLIEYAAELRQRGELLIAAAATVEAVVASEATLRPSPPSTETGAVATLIRAARAESGRNTR